MTTGFSWCFIRIFPKICFGIFVCFGVGVTKARAERVLDLRFWSAERSALALGGLWEFHAETLLEPAQRQLGSELLFDVSQPWRDFRPLAGPVSRPLEQGSYVLLVKGLQPRPDGYALQLVHSKSRARVIVAPKYAPERARRVQTEGVFAVFPLLRTLMGPRLKLIFMPAAVDEIWMIIIQRWHMPPDAIGSIPLLQFAEKSRE